MRSTPPDLALGSGALSLNPRPSNLSGISVASPRPDERLYAPATTAAPLLRKSRRVHHGWVKCGLLILSSPLNFFSGLGRCAPISSFLCSVPSKYHRYPGSHIFESSSVCRKSGQRSGLDASSSPSEDREPPDALFHRRRGRAGG